MISLRSRRVRRILFTQRLHHSMLSVGVSQSQFFRGLVNFWQKCPQNDSKNNLMAPRTTLECPHEGPSVENKIIGTRLRCSDLASGLISPRMTNGNATTQRPTLKSGSVFNWPRWHSRATWTLILPRLRRAREIFFAKQSVGSPLCFYSVAYCRA